MRMGTDRTIATRYCDNHLWDAVSQADSLFRSRTLVHVVVPVLVVFGMLAGRVSFISGDWALARTSDDIAREASAKEKEIDECERTVRETQDALASAMRDCYKTGDLGEQRVWEAILDSENIEQAMVTSQYLGAMAQRQVNAVSDATDATTNLEITREELANLREELSQRRYARENMDSGEYHYCQWGEYYSDIPYFGGSGTIGDSGCGLCAYTTMVNLLCGTHYMPDEMLSIRGDWHGCEEVLNRTTGTPNGMTYKEWTKHYFDIDMETIPGTVEATREALRDEAVVLVGADGYVYHDKAGNWRWSGGHYVVTYRCDGGGFYVHDSSYSGDNGTAVYYTNAEYANMAANTCWLVKCSN